MRAWRCCLRKPRRERADSHGRAIPGQDYHVAQAAIEARPPLPDLADGRAFVNWRSHASTRPGPRGAGRRDHGREFTRRRCPARWSTAISKRFLAPRFDPHRHQLRRAGAGHRDLVRAVSSATAVSRLSRARERAADSTRPAGARSAARTSFRGRSAQRLFGACDVPDLALLPRSGHPGLKTVQNFLHAGFASDTGHKTRRGAGAPGAGRVRLASAPPFAKTLSTGSRSARSRLLSDDSGGSVRRTGRPGATDGDGAAAHLSQVGGQRESRAARPLRPGDRAGRNAIAAGFVPPAWSSRPGRGLLSVEEILGALKGPADPAKPATSERLPKRRAQRMPIQRTGAAARASAAREPRHCIRSAVAGLTARCGSGVSATTKLSTGDSPHARRSSRRAVSNESWNPGRIVSLHATSRGRAAAASEGLSTP